MSKAKVNTESKLKALHQLVLDSETFFSSKELEKLAEKAGFRSMQAKDAVKMLLEEDFITTDKIGSCSVFWALKSETFVRQEFEIQRLSEEKDRLTAAISTVNSEGEISQCQDAGSDDVAALEEKLQRVRKHLRDTQSGDPQRMKQMISEIEHAREAIQRWTDNIDIIRQFTKGRLGLSAEQIDRIFDMPRGWDETAS